MPGTSSRCGSTNFPGELQLSGGAGALTYSAGLSAFGERPRLLPTPPIPGILYTCGCLHARRSPGLTIEERQLLSESYAGYAQGTYRLTERLSATLGARYTHEKKRLRARRISPTPTCSRPASSCDSGDARDSWNSLTYRAGLEYQASPRLMAYGSIARGFKSGGFNVRGETGLPNMGFAPFDPETALTYEIGVRSEWLDRKLRLNATVFHTDYKDIQLRQDTFIDGIFTTLIDNAAKARINGAEVEAMAVPLKGLTLTAAYGHLDPKYLDVGQVRGLTLDSDFQRTPHHSFSGSANYEMPCRTGVARASRRLQLPLEGAVPDPRREQRSERIRAVRRADTFRSRDDRWSIALFGTNLADKRYRTAGRGTLVRQIGCLRPIRASASRARSVSSSKTRLLKNQTALGQFRRRLAWW